MATVLVVDDEPMICSLLEEMFIQKEYTVFTATDGLDALQLYKQCQADIVITDLVMHKMDGLTFIFELRKVCPSVPVILTTGVLPHNREYVKKLNIAYYFEKPFAIKRLIDSVEKLLSPDKRKRVRSVQESE